ELADAAASADLLKTIDSSFLGSAASGMMKTLESAFLGNAPSGAMPTLDSSFLGSAGSLPSTDKTIDSSFLGSAAAPPAGKQRDATEMWDSSHALSESAMSDLAAKLGSSRASVGASAGG